MVQALELRVAQSFYVRVFTPIHRWIYTTSIAKFLRISNLQQRQPKGISDLFSTSPVRDPALTMAGT